jgi:hypothetical protein
MNEFRRLAAKIDQYMQQLSAEGVNDAHAIISRMMGYTPDLYKIWVGTSDDQLIALFNEFHEFYRYAFIMEETSKAEDKKASRPYDGITPFSEQHTQLTNQLLTTAATLERGYQAFLGTGNLQVFQPQVKKMDKQYRQWLSDLESLKSYLHAQGVETKALECMADMFGRQAERIKACRLKLG